MKYLKFHFIFHLPVLAALFFFSPPFFFTEIWAVVILLFGVIIVVATWEKSAVERGIWIYKMGDYLFRVLHLPVEEYVGAVFQALEVMIVCHFLFREFPTALLMERNLPGLTAASVWMPALVFITMWVVVGIMYGGRIRKDLPRASYAWHILYWVLPLFVLEWIPGWDIFLPRWPYLLLPTFLVGSYLSIIDFIAMHWGLRFFDRKQTLGWKVQNLLPWEQVLLNFLACMILTQSFILLLPPYRR